MKHHFGFHAILLLLVLMSPLAQAATDCTAVTEIPSTECEALIALYNSTDGANWWGNYGWNETNTPCSWSDISCSEGHVSALDLSYNQLTGSIPSELGKLSNLRYLYLYDNQLTGSIPSELGNLSNLTYLDLSDNQLTGSIPTELGNLSNLGWLELNNNELTGSIPSELGNLSNLEQLELDNNQLTGSIPSELGNLSNLEQLELDNNELTGSIPTELGNLSNLEQLHLYSNQLTGSIPTELGNLSNLEWLYLDNNQLTGEIPSELGNLSNLRYLYLYDNQLCGEIPVELKNLSSLSSLRLDNNHLTAYDGELIAWLDSRSPGWETTQTSCSGFFTTPIVKVAENAGTVTLTVQRKGDTSGTLEIDYATTDVSAVQGHDYIGATGTLYWAGGDATEKSFTITIIDDGHFEINETFIVTLISPVNGENLDNATIIIKDNEPTDCAAVTEIPSTECEALIAFYNSTDGANWNYNDGWNATHTPCSWHGVSCSEGHVSRLSLSSNQLSGSIPTELGNLTNLTQLELQNNQLTGPIPSELGNLSNLNKLWLNNNQLCGEIPVKLKNLSQIGIAWLYSLNLNLNTNRLTTTDPELIKWLNDHNPSWKHTQTSCSTASVQFSSTTYSLAGNNGQVTVTVTRAGNQAISANYEYNQTTGTLYWAEGDLADKTITITTIDDGKNEEPEAFTITLTSPVSGENLDNATIIINNLFDCTTVTEIPNQECQALIALYDSTGGANWYKWYAPSSYTASPYRPLGWIDTDNPCHWEGVKCSGGHITALELAFTNLVGSIPPELGNLSHLKTLQLGTTYDVPILAILRSIEGYCGGDVFCLKASGWILYDHIQTTENHLSGPIPPELGNLSQLETLQLGVGNLTGPIPAELGNLSQLKTLELHYNPLCGVIPAELKNLSSLSILKLAHNLTASDPELIAWFDEHNPGWKTTQGSCSPQIELEKDSYNPGELFQARLTEKLTSGHDLYAAVAMPDGNFLTLTKENEFVALNTIAKWDGQRIADSPVMLLDLILPDNLPSGEYCFYGILSPKNKPVLESVDLWVSTQRCLFIN